MSHFSKHGNKSNRQEVLPSQGQKPRYHPHQRIRAVDGTPPTASLPQDLRKDQELRGIRNGIIGGYHEWLKVRIRGLDWLSKLKVVSEENFEAPEEDEEVQALKSDLGKSKLAKEKFKLAATHVRKECAGLREENATVSYTHLTLPTKA